MKEENPDEDESITILGNKRNVFKKKDTSTSNQNFTCFECGKWCHMKADCPILAKKSIHKGKKEFKSKKAYNHGMIMK